MQALRQIANSHPDDRPGLPWSLAAIGVHPTDSQTEDNRFESSQDTGKGPYVTWEWDCVRKPCPAAI